MVANKRKALKNGVSIHGLPPKVKCNAHAPPSFGIPHRFDRHVERCPRGAGAAGQTLHLHPCTILLRSLALRGQPRTNKPPAKNGTNKSASYVVIVPLWLSRNYCVRCCRASPVATARGMFSSCSDNGHATVDVVQSWRFEANGESDNEQLFCQRRCGSGSDSGSGAAVCFN